MAVYEHSLNEISYGRCLCVTYIFLNRNVSMLWESVLEPQHGVKEKAPRPVNMVKVVSWEKSHSPRHYISNIECCPWKIRYKLRKDKGVPIVTYIVERSSIPLCCIPSKRIRACNDPSHEACATYRQSCTIVHQHGSDLLGRVKNIIHIVGKADHHLFQFQFKSNQRLSRKL